MNQKKLDEIKIKREKFHKNLTGQIFSDVARKVPLLSSVDKAREKTEIQIKEEARDKNVSEIKKGVSDIDSKIQMMSPFFSPERSLKKLDHMLKFINEEVKSNPDFKINVSIDEKKRVVNISPKSTKELKLKGTFIIKKERLGGSKDFLEFINDKIKKGESIEFGEDEVKNFFIDNPQLNDTIGAFSGPKKLIISPQFLSNPKTIDITVANSGVAYGGVNMGPVYKDEEQITLVSENLPFQIVLIENVKDKKTEVKFKIVEELSLKDTFKFQKFLYELSKNKEIVFSYSSSGKEIGRGSVNMDIPFNKEWLEILHSLVIIDERFNCKFEVPQSVTFEDIDKIKSIREIIETKKLRQPFKDISVIVNKDAVRIMLEKQQTEGSIKDMKIKFEGLSYNLLQRKIEVGNAKAELPPLKIADNLIELKSRVEKENNISVKFIPDNEPEFILNFK